MNKPHRCWVVVGETWNPVPGYYHTCGLPAPYFIRLVEGHGFAAWLRSWWSGKRVRVCQAHAPSTEWLRFLACEDEHPGGRSVAVVEETREGDLEMARRRAAPMEKNQ